MKWFPRSVLIAGLVAYSIITLRMENCCVSKVARDLRIKAAYVSRDATDLIMFIIPSTIIRPIEHNTKNAPAVNAWYTKLIIRGAISIITFKICPGERPGLLIFTSQTL